MNQETLAFLGRLMEFSLQTPAVKENFVLAKGVLLFIEQGANLLLNFKQHAAATVALLFEIYTRHERLKMKCLDTLL